MSINTYGNLKAQVAYFLNRTDLAAYIPDLIVLGEQRIYYGADDPWQSQPLRVPAMQTRTTGSISASAIAFPSDYLEPIRIAASSGGQTWPLAYVSPEMFDQSSAAVPTTYTVLNNTIETAGTGSASYTLDYYGKFDTLSADEDTNWLLTNAPGVYLYGSLLESTAFLDLDPGRMAQWHSVYKAAISSLNRATKYQGSGLAARVVR